MYSFFNNRTIKSIHIAHGDIACLKHCFNCYGKNDQSIEKMTIYLPIFTLNQEISSSWSLHDTFIRQVSILNIESKKEQNSQNSKNREKPQLKHNLSKILVKLCHF